MSQHDLTIANGDGATVRTDIQSALQALGSTSKGPTAPSTAYAGQLWLDDNTPSATLWNLSIFDGSDWIVLGTVNSTTNVFTASASTTPTLIENGNSNVEVTSSNGPIDFDTNGSLRMRILATGAILTGGETSAATGYSSAGDITLPAAGVIRADNTAKAWVAFDASSGTPTILDSFNVTSITDNGVGDFTVNFTNALPSVNYALAGDAQLDTAAGGFGTIVIGMFRSSASHATASARLGTAHSTSAALVDCKHVCVMFLGG